MSYNLNPGELMAHGYYHTLKLYSDVTVSHRYLSFCLLWQRIKGIINYYAPV